MKIIDNIKKSTVRHKLYKYIDKLNRASEFNKYKVFDEAMRYALNQEVLLDLKNVPTINFQKVYAYTNSFRETEIYFNQVYLGTNNEIRIRTSGGVNSVLFAFKGSEMEQYVMVSIILQIISKTY